MHNAKGFLYPFIMGSVLMRIKVLLVLFAVALVGVSMINIGLIQEGRNAGVPSSSVKSAAYLGQETGLAPSPDSVSTNSGINLNRAYVSEPAPMGIADYGIGSGNTPYEYNTSSFEGIININSLSTYNQSLSQIQPGGGTYYGKSYGMSFQLNSVLTFNLSGNTYSYWTQNVVLYNTSANSVYIIDNIWNFSSSSASLAPGTVTGNGTLDSTTVNNVPVHFYYDISSTSLPGSRATLTYPTAIKLKMNSVLAAGVPQVSFSYNDGFGWVTFDNVNFTSANGATDSNFTVNGFSYTPLGSFYDAELILGGPAGATNTAADSANISMQLLYWNGNNYQEVQNAFNYGSDTAEGISNLIVSSGISAGNSNVSSSVKTGSGSLKMIYSRSDLAILNVHVPGASSGALYLNGTEYEFVGSDVNLTIAPGTYSASVIDPSRSYNLGKITVAAGQFLNLSVENWHRVNFTESGLPAGTQWSVNIGQNSFSSLLQNLSIWTANGTYTFTVSSANSNYVNTTVGTFKVNGTALNVPEIVFYQVELKGTIYQAANYVALAVLSVTLVGMWLGLRRRR